MKFKFELEDKYLKYYIEDAYIDIEKIQLLSAASWIDDAYIRQGMYEGEKVLLRTWDEKRGTFPSNFIREVKVMRNQESNPYISQLKKVSYFPHIAWGVEKERYVLIMPITTEISLHNLFRQTPPLSVEERLMIAYDIVTALAGLHSDNTTHQKLHPSNILIKNGRAILTDFSPRNLALTIIDEVPFLAPEIMCGNWFQSASDIYSFGVVFHALLDWQVSKKFRMDTLSEYPAEITKIVTYCKRYLPQDRPTALQLMTMINRLILGLFTPVALPNTPNSYCRFLPILSSVLEENDLFIKPLVGLIAEYSHNCREEEFQCFLDEESKKRELEIQRIAYNRVNPRRDEIWELTFRLLYSVEIRLAAPLCKLVLDYYDNLLIPEKSTYKSLKTIATDISTLTPAVSYPRVRNGLYDNIEQARQKIFEYLSTHQLARFFPEVEGRTINHEFLELKQSYSEYGEWIKAKMRLNPKCPMVHQQNLAIIVHNLQKTNQVEITKAIKDKDNEEVQFLAGIGSVSSSDLWRHQKNLTIPLEQKAAAKSVCKCWPL